MQRKTLTILGNCVAERLLLMLQEYPGFSDSYALKRFPIIPHIDQRDLAQVAHIARQCDIIFTQPLFRYGPCNTDELRKNLRPEQKLIVFSSPKFPAYFADLCDFHGMTDLATPKVMEWDSKIIFSCYVRGVSIFAVEDIYTSHWLFHREYIEEQLEESIRSYLCREQGVDLSTKSYFTKNFTKTKLLHGPRHPVDAFLTMMRDLMVDALDLKRAEQPPEPLTFSFNQWPVITRHHTYFSFPEQNYFVVSGQRFSIEDIAMAYYNFYKFNPQVVEANRHQVIDLERQAGK